MNDSQLQEAIDAARKESNIAHYLGNYNLRNSYNAHLKELLEIQLQRIKDHVNTRKDQQ